MNSHSPPAKETTSDTVVGPAQESLATHHFAWIDILRGLAALGVVLFHARVDLWVGWVEIHTHPERFSAFDRLVAWLSIPLPFLGSGVMLFFLLSGFCIHYPNVSAKQLKLGNYLIRRLARIFPPYLAAVLFSLLIELICRYWLGHKTSSQLTIWKTVFMLQNYPPVTGQLWANPSLWSLPVEVELYLVYPLIFWVSHKISLRWVFGSILFISLGALWLSITEFPWLENNFAKYLIVWCSGAFLAIMFKDAKNSLWKPWYFILSFVAFGVAILSLKILPQFIGYIFWSIGFFFLIILCLSSRKPALLLPKQLLQPLLKLGQISYSLYLIHFPLFRLMGGIWVQATGEKPANLLLSFAAAGVAIGVGRVFYSVVERPTHQLARALGRGKAEVKPAVNSVQAA